MSNINRRSLLAGVGAATALAGLGTIAGAPAAQAYTDLSSSALSWGVKKGIITSTSSTYLNAYVSTGEFLFMLTKSAGINTSNNWYAPYKDVSLNHKYRQPIAWARANKITTVPDNGYFGPDNNITRGVAAMFILRQQRNPRHSTMSKFIDVPASNAHYSGIQWLTDHAGIYGYNDRKFNPHWGMTRKQVVNVMYDLFYENLVGAGNRWIPTGNYRPYTDENGVSSQYHIFADNIDKSKPVGVLYYLEGDSISKLGSPNGYLKTVLAPQAAAKNMILVAPISPNRNGGAGHTWRLTYDRNAAWFRSLARHLTRTFKLDVNNVWTLGFSGGAEFTTLRLAREDHVGWFNRGGAVIVGGGTPVISGAPSISMSVPMKSNYKMVFFTGDADGPYASGSGSWSALSASARGYDYFKSNGYRTSRYIVPNQNHYNYDFAGLFNRAYWL